MTEPRIKIAKRDIVKAFQEEGSRIFKEGDIAAILEKNRAFWRMRRGMSAGEFLAFLLEQTNLEKVSFDFPNRKIIRYVWGQVPLHEILMTLQSGCYFSHYTAMYLHGLTEQVPKTIYVNQEQPAKSRSEGAITQDRIDMAMRRPVRVSGNVVQHEDYRIYLLNGKNTGNLGVVEMDSPEGGRIRVTDVERTLIDVTVRPVYAGGPFEVLKAYKLARPRVSVNKLAATLKKLDYIYPYHQVIGFYLERAGVYKERSIELLRKFDFKYDFYLTHQIKEKAYSERWRLYFPKGL
ncbi:MAG TPA: type IV toxin-antitoxin system AbiEi family antitoxin [Sedimentisphaerales bacterium]|nr:type IV toxin-antitoxin system AbiEi family antitoxin [Sedimentisphaerales bacterium]